MNLKDYFETNGTHLEEVQHSILHHEKALSHCHAFFLLEIARQFS